MKVFRNRLTEDEHPGSGERGMPDRDIRQAAQSNVFVDRRGGSKSLILFLDRRRAARELAAEEAS